MKHFNANDLFEKLIKLTKENTIQWRYLDDDKSICDELNLRAYKSENIFEISLNITSSKAFDVNNSFVAHINNNYIIICCEKDDSTSNKTLEERLSFMLVPRTFRGVRVYTSSDDDGTLLRLQSLVKSYFPSADDIIKDILDM